MYMRKYRAEFEVDYWDGRATFRSTIDFESIWNNRRTVNDMAFERVATYLIAGGQHSNVQGFRVIGVKLLSEEEIA